MHQLLWQIIVCMGGRILVASESGKGSAFMQPCLLINREVLRKYNSFQKIMDNFTYRLLLFWNRCETCNQRSQLCKVFYINEIDLR